MQDKEAVLSRSYSLLDQKAVLHGITDILFSPNRTFLFIFDLFLLSVAFTMSTWSSPYGQWGVWQTEIMVAGTVYVAFFSTIALGMGFYERARRYSIYKIVTTGLLSSLLAVPFGLSTVYFLFYDVFGRLTFVWGAAGSFLCITFFRLLLAIIYKSIPFRFTAVGQSTSIDEIRSFCSSSKNKDAKYFKFVEVEGLTDATVSVKKNVLNGRYVGDIIFTRKALEEGGHLDLAFWALQNRIKIHDEIEFYSNLFERLPLDGISKAWILNKDINPRQLATQAFKRIFDIFFALIGLIVLSPVLILISILIKITSRGPVLFIQPRQGRYNRPFNMIKFRTMTQASSCKSASGGFTKKSDERVTLVGRFIRPLHLDELPQLLNILIGHMSIVGPRPEALSFAEDMSRRIELYEFRYLLRPGLTGHAQIMAGYMMNTVEDTMKKLSFDLFYLTNHSIFFDLRIIIRTFFVVLKQVFSGKSR